MSYLQLDLVFLSIAVIVGAVTLAVRGRSVLAEWGVPVLVAAIALVLLTAVFDTLMIAAGLFHYDPEALLGPVIGLAPLEDFAYPIAAVILLPALWLLVPDRSIRD